MTNEDLWKQDMPRQFASVLVSTEAISDMQNLLRDLMTEKEIIEISARLEVARMLKLGKKYTEIIERTKLSSRTIARISEWLKNGEGGYVRALELVNAHHNHMSPARD